jgi:hypothetical protein
VDQQLLHHGQFGKPGGECQDAALSKVLNNLISSLTKTPMGQFESDATACFDREVMSFVFACFRSRGAPMGPLPMWEQVLQNVVHQVKTAYGISEATYTCTAKSPIHGPGQGSKGGPASCSTMMSLLLEGMDRLGYGLTFSDSSQHLQYKMTSNMFIDDASNCTNDFIAWLHRQPDAVNVVAMLEHDSQTWEQLLWTSGRLLNLSKCLYYVVSWTFDSEGRASMTPAADILPPLTLSSGDDPCRSAVKHFNHDEAREYLGDWLSTNMQMKTGAKTLMAKGLTFSRRLVSSSLSKQDTWIAYFAVFVLAMIYTFAVTHHSTTKLRKIQSAPTRSTLMKLGFNRNMALTVAHGPARYGALRLRKLPIKQGIAGITILIRHLRARTHQDSLVLISLVWWQLVSGLSTPLLEDPTVPFPYDTPHLLSAHRVFLASIGGSLHVADLQDTQPTPLRHADICIIDVVAWMAAYKPAAQAAFNRVRIYFGVRYLSEIVTAEGSSSARDAWEGGRVRLSPFLWPYQPCPGPKSFRNWRRILADAFLLGTRRRVSSRARDLTLRVNVSPWLPASDASQTHWDAFFSGEQNARFMVTDAGRFAKHSALKTRRCPKHPVKAFAGQSETTCVVLPTDAVPAEHHHVHEPNKLVIPFLWPPLPWSHPSHLLPPAGDQTI